MGAVRPARAIWILALLLLVSIGGRPTAAQDATPITGASLEPISADVDLTVGQACAQYFQFSLQYFGVFSDLPQSIQVSWANGQTAEVSMTDASSDNNSVTGYYRTSLFTDSTVTGATAHVPAASNLEWFWLPWAPCHVPPPTKAQPIQASPTNASCAPDQILVFLDVDALQAPDVVTVTFANGASQD
ncbi:MAG: hypothetical protein WBA46_01450, partial [Thermomicrobiales bacterium]